MAKRRRTQSSAGCITLIVLLLLAFSFLGGHGGSDDGSTTSSTPSSAPTSSVSSATQSSSAAHTSSSSAPASSSVAPTGDAQAIVNDGPVPPTLSALEYTGQQEVQINHNNPGFTAAELTTARGPWATYGNLDQLNRVTPANALLNKRSMPTAKRAPLTWDPTGWRNKKTAHGWLYNRSHLIGYQLTGENNNPKNLMTGTQTLNTPLMLAHEMDIAYYLKQSPTHYVRYQVRPVFRGTELLARGVQMRAQSVGDHQVQFNVYIFNVEPGYQLNYADGTSQKVSQQ